MANYGLKFYHVSALPTSGAVTGGIYFDHTSGVIAVWNGTSWENYGGKVADASWSENVLKIFKSDGTEYTLDFNDVASASGVNSLLKTLRDDINNLQTGTGLADGATAPSWSASSSDSLKATTTLKAGIEAVDGALAQEITARAAGDKDTLDSAKAYTDAEIGKLDLDETGADGSYIKLISETDGKVSATAAAFDTEITAGSTNAPTAGAVKTYADSAAAAAIAGLDKADAAVEGQVVKAVSEADGIITVTRAALAATDIKLRKLASPSETTLAAEYELVNGEGAKLGDTIKIAKDQFLKEVHFYAKREDVPSEVTVPTGTEFPAIHFIFTTAAGDTNTWVSVKDLVDVYTAGNGINVDNNVISAVAKSGDSYIEVTSDGIASKGIDDAIATAKTEAIADAEKYADAIKVNGQSQTNQEITIDAGDVLMTGYTKSETGSDIAATDTINAAVGKLEKKIDDAVAGGVTSVDKGTDGDYFTTTVNNTDPHNPKVSGAVTVQAMTSASASSKGLAEASDVKSYVDTADGKLQNNIDAIYKKEFGVESGILIDKINGLDVPNNTSDANAGISITVNEVDGKVSKPSVSVDFGSVTEGNGSVVSGGQVFSADQAVKTTLIGTSSDAATADTIYGAKAYAADAVSNAIAGLDAEEVGGTNKYISSIKEENGKITAVAGDIATAISASDSANLATEGAVKTYVDTAVAGLDATATSENSHGVVINVVEADGKLTGATVTVTPGEVKSGNSSVVTGDAVASAISAAQTDITKDIDDLKKLHADKDASTKYTVKEEIDNAFVWQDWVSA